jgi:hypothetical protein
MEVSGQLDAPASLPPGRNPPRHFGMEGWVGHRAGLDAVMEREISTPCRESNPRTPTVQPVHRESDLGSLERPRQRKIEYFKHP